ncbi:ABC transporter substrate-binding protein [Desulfosarcina sp.]|uniref:ABC transporter substrate-binding protein n=1 Tax=Desulfosarcina sp. TaxID=2027861 RepID=UPI0029A19657|nr:ABC transporter substrate-binding protein [Desulfosarcina sp.]MDX2452507.1 ABC transporter substrate-binding protein [Desulfosarcina sp.]MDX2490281.1 ABC transporter substrate-binding protein [Desulfosarcina sp.]
MNSVFKKITAACVAAVSVLVFDFAAGAAEPVVVGIVHREDFAYAKMMKNAFEMALEEINNAGGIKGQPLQLIFSDDQGEPKTGEQAVKSLVEEKKVVMMVGGYSSSNTLQMAYAADRLDKPFLVATAADDRITRHNLENIYRLNPPASEYTKGLEEFLLDQVKPTSMSIVYENSPYGTGGARQMMDFCRANEIEIKGVHPYFKKGATPEYLQKVLSPIQEDQPDAIFMVSYLDDAVMLVRKAREMKIQSLLCGGAGGFTHASFCRKTGNASENMVTATLWSPAAKFAMAKDFYDRYVKQYSIQPDYHAAEAYSALLVSADALNRSRSLASDDIRAALNDTKIETPFGSVEFKDYGPFKRQNASATQVFQIKNGNFETIWPPVLATSTYSVPSK